MNPYLEKARRPLLDYLGLSEIETVCTRIACDTEKLPEVVGWMRAGIKTVGGHPRPYTQAKHRKAMEDIATRYTEARGRLRASFDGPIIFAVVSHRKCPPSWPKRRSGEQDTSTPDGSNILKLVEDALNSVAYKDDRYIVGEIPLKAPRVGNRDWLEIEITYCEPRKRQMGIDL
ncbi:MAG: RusA family crossover junction endodeoxyribonuclease [Gordonibacter sp.]|uniref:RusA family crossover junction endodeoxyribonuclease n=1 Tax=Gordonibacter sp. TaxID=1968902 RepID=UPI002FC9CC51